MTKGIKYGVDLINDVSGFVTIKKLLNKIKKFNILKSATSYAGFTKHHAN